MYNPAKSSVTRSPSWSRNAHVTSRQFRGVFVPIFARVPARFENLDECLSRLSLESGASLETGRVQIGLFASNTEPGLCFPFAPRKDVLSRCEDDNEDAADVAPPSLDCNVRKEFVLDRIARREWLGEFAKTCHTMSISEIKLPPETAGAPFFSCASRKSSLPMGIGNGALRKSARMRQNAPSIVKKYHSVSRAK
jgi:hypothetical protein